MKCNKALLLALFVCLAVFARAEDAAEASTAPATAGDFTEADKEAIQQGEKFQFQAEVNRLMDILINSLYSNREIFLRELISNAADALDKLRFLSLTKPEILGDNSALDIKISYDKDAKTLTVRDTGIGMTKKQLIDNLGVVAKSGTTEFLAAAQKSDNPLTLIGQFGVGFYSVYLAANRVTVVSKNNDDDQYIWESTAESSFSIAKDPRGNTLGRGTAVILQLKEDAEEFLQESALEKIVAKYSEFINYPIYLQSVKTVEEEVPVEEEEKTEEAKEEEKKDDVEVSEEEDDKKEDEDKPKTKKVSKTVTDYKRVNDAKAVWTRSPKDVTDEEYQEFYKSLTKDDNGAITKIHFTAEGEITFKAILYIPKKAPTGLYDKYYDKFKGLKLYVRRVLISDEFDDFLPRYLNFVRGVVDSDDLPLNVSRETLSQSKVLKVMSKKITRKVLEMLTKLAEKGKKAKKEEKKEDETASDEKKEEDDYSVFFREYGKSIKMGVIDDRSNKAKLQKLLRFQTSKSEGKLISLEDYVKNMKPKQKAIYFITGENVDTVKNSPFLEKLNKKGFEVLLMTDPLDEYLLQSMTEFEGHNLQSITKEGLELDDKSKERVKKLEEEFKPLTEYLKTTYGEKVEKVTVSDRIANSPVVLVTPQYGYSANMERIIRAQAFGNAEAQPWMFAKKIMEINPYHPVIKELKNKIEDGEKDNKLADLANLLYDSALLSSGFQMRDPKEFVERINRVVATGLNVDPNAPVDEPEEEVEEEKKENEENEDEEATNEESSTEAAPASESTEASTEAAPAHDEL